MARREGAGSSSSTFATFDLSVVWDVFGDDADLFEDVLQIPSTATQEAIHIAFFERRKELYHVLVNVPQPLRHSVEREMDAIIMAFRVLKDPKECARYREIRRLHMKQKQNHHHHHQQQQQQQHFTRFKVVSAPTKIGEGSELGFQKTNTTSQLRSGRYSAPTMNEMQAGRAIMAVRATTPDHLQRYAQSNRLQRQEWLHQSPRPHSAPRNLQEGLMQNVPSTTRYYSQRYYGADEGMRQERAGSVQGTKAASTMGNPRVAASTGQDNLDSRRYNFSFDEENNDKVKFKVRDNSQTKPSHQYQKTELKSNVDKTIQRRMRLSSPINQQDSPDHGDGEIPFDSVPSKFQVSVHNLNGCSAQTGRGEGEVGEHSKRRGAPSVRQAKATTVSEYDGDDRVSQIDLPMNTRIRMKSRSRQRQSRVIEAVPSDEDLFHGRTVSSFSYPSGNPRPFSKRRPSAAKSRKKRLKPASTRKKRKGEGSSSQNKEIIDPNTGERVILKKKEVLSLNESHETQQTASLTSESEGDYDDEAMDSLEASSIISDTSLIFAEPKNVGLYGRLMESSAVKTVSEEAHGAYLDTVSAFYQVFSAFTLQDNEIDAVCDKINSVKKELDN